MRPLGLSNQCELMREERFGVTFRRTAFHPPQPRQSQKRLSVEPLLRTLASKM